MYGVIAIVGQVEIIAAVILLPAIINSFLFVSSAKIVEHRQIRAKPVDHDEEFRLRATKEKTAPITLVRLILAGGPMTENQVGHAIFKLAIFSGILGIVTAFMMAIKI